MIGAIAGDMVGSVYEFNNIKTTEFPLFSPGCRFTDDTVLTVALADAILNSADYTEKLKEYYRSYPKAGFGGSFRIWAESADNNPYNSWGNGAAMRISPVGFAYESLAETLQMAEKFTAVTHNHPEGIKGACATAAVIYLARTGSGKEKIRSYIEGTFGYDLHRSVDSIRPDYHYEISCQKTVPEAIIAFLDSTDFENALRLAVSLGGDSDTLACITGGMAQAFYGMVPLDIEKEVFARLDAPLAEVTHQFMRLIKQVRTSVRTH
jgi:ADP-ribosylglycohydrolase